MLTTKKISANGKASDIVAYLMDELTRAQAPSPDVSRSADLDAQRSVHRLAAYYGANQAPVRAGAGMAEDVAEYLGLVPGATPSAATLERIISGRAADGSRFLSEQAEVAGFDYTLSVDRSVSVAYALAPTADERAAILGAHRAAVADFTRELEIEMGFTRRGHGGTESVEGRLAWAEFDHTASRPVSARALYCDDPNAPPHSAEDLLTGDPNLHTHLYLPNLVFCRDEYGQVHTGTIDSERLRGRTHEFGAFYQSRLAHHLERLGIEIEWDGRGAVRVAGVSENLRELFSKRARAGEAAARNWAAERGLNYDELDPAAQHTMMRTALGLDRKQKEGLQANFADWQAQAEAAGFTYTGVIPSDDDLAARSVEPVNPELRLAEAVQRADQLAADLFAKESVLTLQQIRVCCAQATIGLLKDYDDVARVQAQLLEQGITVDGHRTPLIVGYLPTIDATRPERDGVAGAQKKPKKASQSARGDEMLVTTQKHVDNERAVVDLTRQAAADRTGALSREEIDREVRRAETRAVRPLSFDSDHGRAQLDMAHHLGQGARIALGIGAAGSGKTTLAQPLVSAWRAKEMTVHGIAVAWRQANDLEDAGIAKGNGRSKRPTEKTKRSRSKSADNGDEATAELSDAGIEDERIHAVAAFVRRFDTGKIVVDENTVILLDEVGQLGVKDAVRLLEIQRQTRCHLKMIGDPLQCVSVEAGPTIDLLIRALGAENVPTLLSTIRQAADTEKRNAALFRSGQAEAALGHKRADGTARLVRGDSEAFAAHVAERWAQVADEASEAGITFGVSAPTNAQARLVGNAIRIKRRERGEITGEDRVVSCTDSLGKDQFDLALAVGDKVRLFRKTRGRRVDGGGGVQLGVNGTICEIQRFTPSGVILRNAAGLDVEVKWKTLTHKHNGRILFNRGEVFTPDSSQGATRHLWLDTMPGGSDAMTAGKTYVVESRHRIRSEMLVSEDAEREAILRERALGDTTTITEDQVWERIAKNLSRTGAKISAMVLMEKALGIRQAAADVLLRLQVDRASRLERGQNPDTAAAERRQGEQAVSVALPAVATAIRRAHEVSEGVRQALRGIAAGLAQGEAQMAARSVVAAVGAALSQAAPRIAAAVQELRRRRLGPEAEIEVHPRPAHEYRGPSFR